MRLFHHFLVAAFPHFPVRSDNIWISYITPLSHQCEYLMHAMLALSASHLERLAPSCLTVPAQNHRLASIKGLNETLSKPLSNSDDGDAAIATCYALLVQSWYMDDGLQAFLVLTRSCGWTSKWVKEQKCRSILARECDETRLGTMKSRLKDAPRFNGAFVEKAAQSLVALESLYEENVLVEVSGELMKAYKSLSVSPLCCYEAYVNLDRLIRDLDHVSFLHLVDPDNEICQILLAHLVALHLIMRPVSCRERKHHTVAMYGIRMSTWIPGIYNAVSEQRRDLLEWPMWVAQLHTEGSLEKWSLASEK